MSDRETWPAWGPPEGPGRGESPAPGAEVRVTPGTERAAAPGVGAPGVGAPVARRRGSRRKEREPRLRILGPWLLLVVLAVQAALSLRLVRADTAFDDEAMSLWAGHLLWAHWLHGTSIPQFPKYFSGAPVIYPPLGALADSVAGLAGARVLSLVFMLGATVLLWGTTNRLFGQRAALFAAALFAVLSPTLHLGAFATFDALRVVLVALAAWCVVQAGDRGRGTGWMVTAGIALAVANAAAYSSAVFDLVVLALALLTAWPSGGRLAARRCATVLLTTLVLLAAGVLIGGSAYLSGFARTTLAPAPGASPPLSVLAHSASWAGLIVVLAVCGVIISLASRSGWAQTLLLAVCTAAVVVGPLEQARQHALASLNEHVGLGAWFGTIAAGYAVDRFIAAAPAGSARAVTYGACVVALAFPVTLGVSQSWGLATDWPNATSFLAILRPLADHGAGHLLVEDPAVARYYLPAGRQWQRWSSTRNIILPSGVSTGGPASTASVAGAGNAGVFAEFITRGYFSYVALNFADTTALDHRLADQLHRDPRYHTIAVVPYGTEVPPLGQGTYVIWRYEPKR
jgi:Dolichyl-phosphate-mannose-protein mannosyltransferase